MAIDDPTALPENAAQTTEYLREADLAFEREQLDLALTLYWSASTAGLFDSDGHRNHAYVRVGTILVGQGNDADAYRWLQAAGPAGADLLKVIEARTVDAPVDPDVIPETSEVLNRYLNAATTAHETKDYSTFDQLVARIMDSTATTPGERSNVELLMAHSLLDRGQAVHAKEWAEASLAESSGSNAHEVRELIDKAEAAMTTDELVDHDQRWQDYGLYLAAAISAFESEAGDRGKSQLETIVADTTGLIDDAIRGQARYYLGMLAYHQHDFDVAREHFEFALANASDPEHGYAGEALRWRYQEEG